MSIVKQRVSRRDALATVGTLSMAATIGPLLASSAAAVQLEAPLQKLIPSDARHLKALMERLVLTFDGIGRRMSIFHCGTEGF